MKKNQLKAVLSHFGALSAHSACRLVSSVVLTQQPTKQGKKRAAPQLTFSFANVMSHVALPIGMFHAKLSIRARARVLEGSWPAGSFRTIAFDRIHCFLAFVAFFQCTTFLGHTFISLRTCLQSAFFIRPRKRFAFLESVGLRSTHRSRDPPVDSINNEVKKSETDI